MIEASGVDSDYGWLGVSATYFFDDSFELDLGCVHEYSTQSVVEVDISLRLGSREGPVDVVLVYGNQDGRPIIMELRPDVFSGLTVVVFYLPYQRVNDDQLRVQRNELQLEIL